jgi:hypothetical protein
MAGRIASGISPRYFPSKHIEQERLIIIYGGGKVPRAVCAFVWKWKFALRDTNVACSQTVSGGMAYPNKGIGESKGRAGLATD